MAKYIGRLRAVGIGKETVRGTAVAPSFFIPKTDFDFEEKKETILNESGIGIIDNAFEQQKTKRMASGSVSGNLPDQSIGLVLLATFGAVADSLVGGETIVYDHDFTVANTSNEHQSLTIALDEANGDYRFANAMVESFEITAVPADFVKFNVSFMAKQGVTATETPSFIDENTFTGKDVCFKVAADLAGLDAANEIGTTSLSVNFTKNLEEIFENCSEDPTDFLNTMMDVTGVIEAFFDNETDFKDAALNNTQKALRITIKNTAVTLGVASNPELQIDFSKVYFNEFARTSTQDEIVKQSLTFQSVYSVTDATRVTAKLTNLTASY